jgi:hypothetical protein
MCHENKTSLKYLVDEKKSFAEYKLDKAVVDEKPLDEGMLDRYDWVESSVVNDIGFDSSKIFTASGKGNNLDIRRVWGSNILNLSGNPTTENVDSIYVRCIPSYAKIMLTFKEFE